jgi:quercetin dioxygenase-like cupin family protein
MLLILGTFGVVTGQSTSTAILSNLDTASWTHEKGDPAGSESVMLRMDQTTGGMDLLVRFPAGHVIAPHSHESNERIVVVEGQLMVRQDKGDVLINAGGFAFLPAGEVQRLSCSSKTRCTLYLSWDGKVNSRPAK